MVRAAWLYHAEGMTQAEIAEHLHVTRRRVNEMLARARETGVVSISFNSRPADCAELEVALRARYGLEDAVVAPAPANPEKSHSVIGRATADYLNRLIPSRKPRSLGVGWGATLRETIRYATPQKWPDLTVRSMMGGLTQGAEINTFETVSGFAKLWGSQCRYFVAPIYAESPESRDIIIQQAVFQKIFRKICEVDIALVSVGDVTEKSLQVRYGLPDDTSAEDLRAAHAVGDLIGRYLDAGGQPVAHRLNRQVLAPELDAFRRIPCRVIIGGGAYKIPVLRAVVAAGHASVLVTDEECARALLEADPRPSSGLEAQ